MDAILTPAQGIIYLVSYGACMMTLTWIFTHNRSRDKTEFLLASRKVGVWPGALSIAASWIWAPALFVSSEKAYTQGIAGAFWFIVPNVLALIVFAPFALKARKMFPSGFTLPEYILKRHGRNVHALYVIQFVGLQICSFAVQILAGSMLIHLMTSLSFHAVGLSLVAITLSYSVFGGIRASIVTDAVQMILILAISFVVVPLVLSHTGGFDSVVAGFGGVSGKFSNVFDPWVAYSFGIPVTIGLLSGPLGDQMHWSRAFAIERESDILKTFFLGAGLFVVVPLTLCLLGFIAANPAVSSGWSVTDSQMIGPIVVSKTLPPVFLIAYSIMIMSGLCSTLDSVLCAASSLGTVDVFTRRKTGNDIEDEKRSVLVARGSMLATAALGTSIAFIPGIKLVHLFLFYGTWRASTLIPTIYTLSRQRLSSKAVFWAILASLIFGAPIYAAGALLNNPHLSVAGSLTVVTIGFAACQAGSGKSTQI